MSTVRRLKSSRSLPGTSAHPTMVTLVNIMVMNGWLTTVQKSPFHLSEWLLHFGRNLTKHNYPSTPAAYKTNPIISDNQTFIYSSAKNKDYPRTALKKILKIRTLPVPKDPYSKVKTFPGNKDQWEPCYVQNDLMAQPWQNTVIFYAIHHSYPRVKTMSQTYRCRLSSPWVVSELKYEASKFYGTWDLCFSWHPTGRCSPNEHWQSFHDNNLQGPVSI